MDAQVPGGAEILAIGCTAITCFWWFLSIVVPWYFFAIDDPNGSAQCFINGDCRGSGSFGDFNVGDIDRDLQRTFEATTAFMIMAFFCLFVVLIILLVKKFWAGLQNRNLFLIVVPLMGIICLFFLLAFIIFPSGVSSNNPISDGDFAGEEGGVTFGPSAGWPMTFFLWCCFIPAFIFVYLSNQFTTSFGESSGGTSSAASSSPPPYSE